MGTVVSVEKVSKRYDLGSISSNTLRRDFERWSALWRGKTDPYAKVDKGQIAPSDQDFIWALNQVSFRVGQGEVLGIIGRNGSGKSTLLKILSRVTVPTTGQARIKGRVASLLEVGTGFHPDLTGRENVFLNGAILGMTRSEIQRKFDEIVEFSGVEQFIDTPVKRYSSGMNVRLAFAVAAHLEPEILIIDEVLAVGDAEFQKKCLGKMGSVVQEGRTVLFVSHQMAAVQSLCTRVIWLALGQVSLAGETQEVVDAYLAGAASHSLTDLDQRTDRKGSGALHLMAIEYRGAAGEPLKLVQSGQDLQVALRYRARADNIRNISVDFSVLDANGQALFMCSSDFMKQPISSIPREGYLVCSIPHLGLMPGQHSLNVRCRVNGEIADRVQEAAELVVEAGDFFGVGRLPRTGKHGVLMEHSWRVEPVG
jgi:lipopolysaccharide transport system ATP-binding protein